MPLGSKTYIQSSAKLSNYNIHILFSRVGTRNATSKSRTKKTYCLPVVSFQFVLRCPLTAADMEKHSFTFICNSLTHCSACNSLCVMWGRHPDVFIHCGQARTPRLHVHFIQVCSVHLSAQKT